MKTIFLLVLAFYSVPTFCVAQPLYRPPTSGFRQPALVRPMPQSQYRPLIPQMPKQAFQFPRPYNPDPMTTVRQGQQARFDAAQNLAETFRWHVQPNMIRRPSASDYRGPSFARANREYPRIIENLGPNSSFPDHLRLRVRMPNGQERIYLVTKD